MVKWNILCKAILMSDISMEDAVTIINKFEDDITILDKFPEVCKNIQILEDKLKNE